MENKIFAESVVRSHFDDPRVQKIVMKHLQEIGEETQSDTEAYAVILLMLGCFQAVMQQHNIEVL